MAVLVLGSQHLGGAGKAKDVLHLHALANILGPLDLGVLNHVAGLVDLVTQVGGAGHPGQGSATQGDGSWLG